MAKYSTGGVGGDSSGACELCGAEDRALETATVAGAKLEVCSQCATHGERTGGGSQGGGGGRGDQQEENRQKRAARNVAKLDDARKAETDFESGMDYEDDPLPYLVRGYADVVASARQDAGLTIEELAAELDVDPDDLEAIEQGRAARANVGGSVVEALEEHFDVDLTE